MNNIILIGMPGVGKSTVGSVLAEMLGYQFIDADTVIQEETGKQLWEIIEKEGIDGFIQIEGKINQNIDVDNTVIATGGSVIYVDKTMEEYQKKGTIVYIQQNFSHIQKRVDNTKDRGVVLRENQSFFDLYKERIPLYEKYADIIVSQEDDLLEETVQKIVNALQRN